MAWMYTKVPGTLLFPHDKAVTTVRNQNLKNELSLYSDDSKKGKNDIKEAGN
jgi:hypothetical protein